jgi:SAM-dependent methyltransferase
MSIEGRESVAPSAEQVTERVRARYAAAAQRVRSEGAGGCCGTAGDADDVMTGHLYSAEEAASLPEEALAASLGCGNPTALIDLRAGETVLDLGSGGGIDVLLSARRVGPTGFAYGLDMTDEMLALALENKARSGLTNVAFLKGRMEQVPLPARSVDVVISNCVINLAPDKGQVLREAFRVLRPGGRFAVSDVVADGPVPAGLRGHMEAWVGCLAGALEIAEYERLLAEAGFTDVSVTVTRRYTVAEAGLDPTTLPAGWQAGDGKLASAFVRATRPADAPDDATDAPTTRPERAALPIASGGGCCGGAGGCCGE